jgi:RHS repeat-associated protein
LKYQFTGKEWNDDFGLGWNDYGARFYDPALGRWHSVDPLAELAVDKTPYHYCSNDPVNRVDPDGMADCGCSYGECKGKDKSGGSKDGGDKKKEDGGKKDGKSGGEKDKDTNSDGVSVVHVDPNSLGLSGGTGGPIGNMSNMGDGGSSASSSPYGDNNKVGHGPNASNSTEMAAVMVAGGDRPIPLYFKATLSNTVEVWDLSGSTRGKTVSKKVSTDVNLGTTYYTMMVSVKKGKITGFLNQPNIDYLNTHYFVSATGTATIEPEEDGTAQVTLFNQYREDNGKFAVYGYEKPKGGEGFGSSYITFKIKVGFDRVEIVNNSVVITSDGPHGLSIYRHPNAHLVAPEIKNPGNTRIIWLPCPSGCR